MRPRAHVARGPVAPSDIASGRATLILLHVKNGMLFGVFMGRVRIRERGAPTPAGRAARGRRARGGAGAGGRGPGARRPPLSKNRTLRSVGD